MVAGSGLVAAAMLWPGGQAWWLEWLRYLPYPLTAAVSLATVGLAAALGPRWAAAAPVSAVATAAWSPGFALNLVGPEAAGLPLRAMSFNVKSYLAERERAGVEFIALTVRAQDPDIVLLQDVGRSMADAPSRRHLVGALHAHAEAGLGIASRWPLERCEPWRLAPHDPPYALACIARLNGRAVRLVSAHLATPRAALNALRQRGPAGFGHWRADHALRNDQAAALAARLRGDTLPTVLGGDLNSPPGSRALARLAEVLPVDAFAAAGTGTGLTQGHALWPHVDLLRIDYVLASAGFGVSHCEVVDSQASEHRPVLADLALPGPPP